MKTIFKFTSLALCAMMMSCGGGAPQPKSDAPAPKSMVQEKLPPASERITLDEKGVGQVSDLPLDAEINQDLVAEGAAIFKTNCSACHKVEKRFIGPSPKGIMERRSPEWIMNMILDPQLMVEQDRCAMDMLVEFNGAAMANQNLTFDQARAILEYFRTL